jgi:hypothetical protein
MSRTTPWGAAQQTKQVAHGITRIDTASHGGYHLSAERLATMPEQLRRIEPFAGTGWYEEDCDWSIVALAFPQHFDDFAVLGAVETQSGEFGKQLAREYLDQDPRGRVVARRAYAFRRANADKFRDAGGSTSGNGWTVWAENLGRTERLSAEFPRVPALPTLFTKADIERLGGRIVKGAKA